MFRKFRRKIREQLKQPQFYPLMIFSTFVYLISALVIRFLTNLETSIFLRYLSVSFQYRPFDIFFHSVGGGKWNDNRIMIVYGIGTLVFLLSGLFLFRVLAVIKKIGFKTRLTLTWLTFLAVHVLPLGMISGAVLFDDFGIAYTWLFPEIWVRLILGLLAVALCIFFRPFWIKLFLRTAYSSGFLHTIEAKKDFILRIFIIPWIIGTLILLPFSWAGHHWTWFIYLLCLGLIVLPLFNPKFPKRNPRIVKSEGPPLLSIYSLILMVIIITGMLLTSLVRIEF
ncbi:MAG: hypothetical protein WCI71_10790 [Bacteroidota bacterium]